MKRNISLLFWSLLFCCLSLHSTKSFAQEPKDAKEPQFTTIIEQPVTSIKNQYRSGTCWAFATISFLESEAIRINKIKDKEAYPDFSEMFVVSKSYQDRAAKYVRLDGHLNFSPGSECDDVLHVVNDYGIVPQEVMPGTNYGTELPVHGELDATTKAFVEAIVKNPNKKLSTAWKTAFRGIVDAYLGSCPTEFTYKGKKYTPASFRDSYKINSANYLTLSSFTDKTYYKAHPLELCDNWRGDLAYNLPIDEFMTCLRYAIENGYTVAWGADVSERGFGRHGIAVHNMVKEKSTAGSDQARWVGKSDDDKKKEEGKEEKLVEEAVTDTSRQKDYDAKLTTDDHGMHIFGLAKDQNGTIYYMVKNSWGETGKFKGIWYVSETYVKAKSMDIMLHKDSLPKQIKKKLNL